MRRAHRPQPRAEVLPDQRRLSGGEALEQALRNEPDLDVPVIRVELAPDGRAVAFGFVMEMLVALKPPQRGHAAHPEVIGPGADGVQGLLERDLDFETQGVQPVDFCRSQSDVGAEQQNPAALGMDDRDETHEATGGPPEQILISVLHGDALLVVDRARHRLPHAGEEIAQPDLSG